MMVAIGVSERPAGIPSYCAWMTRHTEVIGGPFTLRTGLCGQKLASERLAKGLESPAGFIVAPPAVGIAAELYALFLDVTG
jgi:hypothetical protein